MTRHGLGRGRAIDRRGELAAAICVLTVVLVAVAGCKSPQAHREEADAVAARIIDRKQQEALGRTEPFTIERPATTLRRRLLKAQGLPISHDASVGVDAIEPVEHWPKRSNYLTKQRWAPPRIVEQSADEPIRLSLEQALQVAALNSRDYQTQKESVFRTALDLELERDAFRNSYGGLIESLLVAAPGSDPDELGLENTGELSLERRLKSGATLSTRLLIDLAQLLRPTRTNSAGLFADLSISVPLLSGSGRHIVTEPLTQAERNMIYALWSFERFKRTFAVRVASDYLQVLQQLDVVRNAESNYRRLIESAQRTRALADAGRLSEIDVDQVNQDVLRARDSWIRARETYEQQVDRFKLLLGLPTDARIGLASAELNRLAETAEAALGEAGVVEGADEPTARAEGYTVEDGELEVRPPGKAGAGPMELAPARAIALALMQRLDLRAAGERVADAQREVFVAADALRPGLTLSGSASAGERRGIGSADEPNAGLEFAEGDYRVGLALDLPWEKTAERIAYRNALIDLEAAARDVQALEDEVKFEVRDALRQLEQARTSYRIQAEAVALAERRVESSNLFLQAGRAEIRDVLEAEEALVNAQDALTDALVSYRVTELELQRDMGVLRVDHQGLWREYDPDNDGPAGG